MRLTSRIVLSCISAPPFRKPASLAQERRAALRIHQCHAAEGYTVSGCSGGDLISDHLVHRMGRRDGLIAGSSQAARTVCYAYIIAPPPVRQQSLREPRWRAGVPAGSTWERAATRNPREAPGSVDCAAQIPASDHGRQASQNSQKEYGRWLGNPSLAYSTSRCDSEAFSAMRASDMPHFYAWLHCWIRAESCLLPSRPSPLATTKLPPAARHLPPPNINPRRTLRPEYHSAIAPCCDVHAAFI